MSTPHDSEPPLRPVSPAQPGSTTAPAPAPASTSRPPASAPAGSPAGPSSAARPTSPAKPSTTGGKTPPRPTPAQKNEQQSMRTRTASLWVGIGISLLVLIALVIFMMQNTEMVEVTFLGATGSAPLAAVCLISGIAVGVVVLLVGALRIHQLRRRVKHERHP